MQTGYAAGCRVEEARGAADRARVELIEHLKLAGYFLIVWDWWRFCREQKILAQGRDRLPISAVATRSASRR